MAVGLVSGRALDADDDEADVEALRGLALISMSA
jgi:hypothetical protein